MGRLDAVQDDDDVELVQALGQVGQAHGLGAEARGELLAALQRAVGHGHWASGAAAKWVAQLDHLARADEQHAGLGEVLEQLASQAHGGGMPC